MKKVISYLLAITVLATALTGCDRKAEPLVGTWRADGVEVDGTKYTMAELDAMGDNSISRAQIVVKEGGKAYVSDGHTGNVVDWTKTEAGVTIGEQDCTIADGMICLAYGEGTVFFKKISDSQTIENGQTDDTDVSSQQAASSAPTVAIKESPDKYTWYIKSYVGKNCASFGYTSIGGDRMDTYGAAVVKLVLVAKDGSFVDPEDTKSLKSYVVTKQSVAPNSKLKLVFDKDSDGVEYDYLVESQNIEEIELTVKPIGSK